MVHLLFVTFLCDVFYYPISALRTWCPINMETRSTLIFSFCISATAKVKPLLKSLDRNLPGATLILIFFKKFNYFLGRQKKEQK